MNILLDCLFVGAGGFIGSVLRYLCNYLPPLGSLPVATFLINIVGSFLLGLISTVLLTYGLENEHLSLFLRIGLCGGFTTFSTFSLEAMNLIQDGDWAIAVGYMVLSCAVSVLAAVLGCFVGSKL